MKFPLFVAVSLLLCSFPCRGGSLIKERVGIYLDLTVAAKWGDINAARILLGNRAKIEQGDSYGYTDLIFAAGNDCRDIVRTLLGKRAEINTGTIDGVADLGKAAAFGHRDIARTLLGNRAEIGGALIVAAERCLNEVCRALFFWKVGGI